MPADGFNIHSGYLNRTSCAAMVAEVRAVIAVAPLYAPRMPRSGKPMSVRMTNCGPLGWFTDARGGYRYVDRHPETGAPWPAIPDNVMAVWNAVAGYPHPPEACLVNYYGPHARMGLHRDMDEKATDAPVVSISLGDDALFRLGGSSRKDKTVSVKLSSGDVVVLGGESRHFFHGIDKIYPGTSTLLPEGGRFNLTLRRVTSV